MNTNSSSNSKSEFDESKEHLRQFVLGKQKSVIEKLKGYQKFTDSIIAEGENIDRDSHLLQSLDGRELCWFDNRRVITHKEDIDRDDPQRSYIFRTHFKEKYGNDVDADFENRGYKYLKERKDEPFVSSLKLDLDNRIKDVTEDEVKRVFTDILKVIDEANSTEDIIIDIIDILSSSQACWFEMGVDDVKDTSLSEETEERLDYTLSGGGRARRRKPKILTGPQGGKYYVKDGAKVYVTSAAAAALKRRKGSKKSKPERAR